jgi:hypothetical protein
MSAALYWHSLLKDGPYDRKLFVKGTELSVAYFGPNLRFAAYEVRCLDADGQSDRRYVVRDAETVSDDVLAGKRPSIVGQTSSYNELQRFVEKHTSQQD